MRDVIALFAIMLFVFAVKRIKMLVPEKMMYHYGVLVGMLGIGLATLLAFY